MKQKFYVDNFAIFSYAEADGRRVYAQLDTGAQRSFIYPESKIRPLAVRERRVAAAIGSSVTTAGRVMLLRFLGREFRNVDVNILSKSSLEKYSTAPEMTIGADLLYSFEGISFDFEYGMVGETPRRHPGARKVDVQMAGGLCFFPLCLSHMQLNSLFDTGAGYSILNLRVEAELKSEIHETGMVMVTDPAGGKRKMKTFTCSSFSIAGLTRKAAKFLVLDLTWLEDVLGTKVDFILGVNMMKSMRWDIFPKRGFLHVSLATKQNVS
ncbi:MAG: pepsin/retropepsin-like aspartic protease family protein [Conexivisphaerales archaeon]